MVRAAQTFHVTDPQTRRPVVFYGPGAKVDGEYLELGQEVPLEIALKVGDHVLDWEGEERPEVDADEEITVKRSEFDAAVAEAVEERVGEAKYSDADLEKARQDGYDAALADVASLAPEPQDGDAGSDDDPEKPYDPDAHGAKEVADYLKGLDQSDEKQKAEYDRVVAAEKAGQNRSTAIPS